jgi:hypothetical protein
MSERKLLIPALLVVAVGAPIVYHEMKSKESSDAAASYEGQSHEFATFANLTRSDNQMPTRNISRPHVVPVEQPFQLAGFPGKVENPVTNSLTVSPEYVPQNLAPQMVPLPMSDNRFTAIPTAASLQPGLITSQSSPTQVLPPPTFLPPPTGPIIAHPQTNGMPEPIDFSSMTPDYGAAQTLVFPGNQFGPDLSAEPLEHLPVQDFSEIFRFDLNKSAIQQRWKRISTNPADFRNELSGMRVPLVTGTNSWDLHGSLTYYFDTHQHLQRITFRGWTGNPQKLLNWLTSQYQFKPQPTTLAGFYLGETNRKTHGGIMLKTPPVIDSSNPLEQYGIVMEMNRPDGPFELSEEYRRLIAGSHPK